MALTTTTLFGDIVEYPKTTEQEVTTQDEQNEIKDTVTGNLFLQDFVEINKSEISYLFQSE